VVELIRIRTLAEAGVPLARVQELLEAGEAEFAAAVAEIDRRLRAEIRELQENRGRIARLAAGDSLALPSEVVAYLESCVPAEHGKRWPRVNAMPGSSSLLAGRRRSRSSWSTRWPNWTIRGRCSCTG
jgi:hypothetical protein